MSKPMSRREFLGSSLAFATVVSLVGCSSGGGDPVSEYASPDAYGIPTGSDGMVPTTDGSEDPSTSGSGTEVEGTQEWEMTALYATPDVTEAAG